MKHYRTSCIGYPLFVLADYPAGRHPPCILPSYLHPTFDTVFPFLVHRSEFSAPAAGSTLVSNECGAMERNSARAET